MALATQTINLDLRPHYNRQNTNIVYCSQYDSDLRNVVVNIADAGTAVNVSTYTIYVEGTKPDKHGFSYELTSIGGTVASNVVTFPLQLQMTAVAGITNAELVFYSGDERIGSANFILAVEQAGLADDIDVSDTDIPAYVDGAQQAAQAAEDAKDAAVDAKDLAVSAADTAQTVLDSIPEDYTDLSNDVEGLKNALQIAGEDYLPLPIINNSRVSLGGVIVENATGWQRTDYIDVSEYETLKIIAPQATSYSVFFKADKTFDSQKAVALGTNILSVPSTAKYYMLCVNASNLSSFLIYSLDKMKIEQLEKDVDNCAKLASANLFDKSTITADSFVNYTNGNVQSTTVGACASDWIECEAETTYVMSNATNHQTNSCAFYDASKTYISGITTSGARAPYVFTTPENAVYMRWTVYNVVIDSTQIEKGSTPTPYSAYQMAVQIKDINLPALEYALTKEVTVGASGCDYTSLLEALASTSDGTPIRVTTGTYDIAQEYTDKYGSDYWTNYAGYATTNPFDRGLWVTNGRKVTLEAGAKLVFNLDGSTTVKNQFSVFATGYNAHIEGGCIDIGQNLCRYAIHDDWGSQNGTNVFENIVFVGSPVSQSHIGGGMGYHLNYRIENCIFLDNSGACDISYHNNLSAEAENKLEVTGCYGSKKCVFRWYGNSTKISYAVVHDCHFSEIYAEPHPTATPNTNVNVQLIAFNNEISA